MYLLSASQNITKIALPIVIISLIVALGKDLKKELSGKFMVLPNRRIPAMLIEIDAPAERFHIFLPIFSAIYLINVNLVLYVEHSLSQHKYLVFKIMKLFWNYMVTFSTELTWIFWWGFRKYLNIRINHNLLNLPLPIF